MAIKPLLPFDIGTPSAFIGDDKRDFENSIVRIKRMAIAIDKAGRVINSADVPETLSSQHSAVRAELAMLISALQSKQKEGEKIAEYLHRVNTTLRSVNTLYERFFDITASDNIFLRTITGILAFDISNTNELDIEIQSRLVKTDAVLQEASAISKELSRKATEKVVSDYAGIFEKEEMTNESIARIWLITSLVLCVSLVVGLVVSLRTDFFNVVHYNGEINYVNLVGKFFIISFTIFVIGFCFKQYSINKNLQTLNNHRKNALNSYELFSKSIGAEDPGSKSALMLHVAKAIYEQSSTGYLSQKTDSSSPSIVEFTKVFSNSKAVS